MEKIEELTPEQEAFLPKWRKRFLEIGIDTKPGNEKKVENCIDYFYQVTNNKKPKHIWVDSPLAANILINIWDELDKLPKDYKLETLKKLSKGKKLTSFSTSFWGQQEAYWICFYLFAKIIRVKYKPEDYKLLLKYLAIAKNSFWYYPFKNVCIIVRKPKTVKLNAQERKHCDGGPAVEFHNGFTLWALNDVVVSKEIAETPAEKLDPGLILKEKNVEIRRELLRKIGVERFLTHTHSKTIDKETITIEGSKTKQNYELLLVGLGDGVEPCPALKMEHASLPGVYLIEFVSRECKTVREALTLRNGTDELPYTLS